MMLNIEPIIEQRQTEYHMTFNMLFTYSERGMVQLITVTVTRVPYSHSENCRSSSIQLNSTLRLN